MSLRILSSLYFIKEKQYTINHVLPVGLSYHCITRILSSDILVFSGSELSCQHSNYVKHSCSPWFSLFIWVVLDHKMMLFQGRDHVTTSNVVPETKLCFCGSILHVVTTYDTSALRTVLLTTLPVKRHEVKMINLNFDIPLRSWCPHTVVLSLEKFRLY